MPKAAKTLTTTCRDYYPFGMEMPGRSYEAGGYRFGFGGEENDSEILGQQNSIDFGSRIYHAQLGRWLSCDPFTRKYPYLSPYVYVENSPLLFVDIGGDSTAFYNEKGVLLWITHDRLQNSIIIVKDENLIKFRILVGLGELNDERNSDSHVEQMRTLGIAYNLVELGKWANTLASDEEGRKEKPHNSQRNEKRTYTIETNGTIIPFNDAIDIGDPSTSYPPENRPENPTGIIHTHPLHIFVNRNPSAQDLRNMSAVGGAYRNIIVEVDQNGKNILGFYFYSNKTFLTEELIRFNIVGEDGNSSDGFDDANEINRKYIIDHHVIQVEPD